MMSHRFVCNQFTLMPGQGWTEGQMWNASAKCDWDFFRSAPPPCAYGIKTPSLTYLNTGSWSLKVKEVAWNWLSEVRASRHFFRVGFPPTLFTSQRCGLGRSIYLCRALLAVSKISSDCWQDHTRTQILSRTLLITFLSWSSNDTIISDKSSFNLM